MISQMSENCCNHIIPFLLQHIPVCPEDVILQFIRLGGRAFLERCLTFGSGSSPGIFDDVAELVLVMALWLLAWARRMACRQLDDTIMIAYKQEVLRWHLVYTDLCSRLGIRLAPEEENKAFGCQTRGVLLGIMFDLEAWTWSMESKKAEKVIRLLAKITVDKSITMKELGSLNGKISFYMDIFSGRWERAMLLAPGAPNSKNNNRLVDITPGMISQASWWMRRMTAAAKHPDRIPDYRVLEPATCVHVFPDSAGGLGGLGAGFGAAVWTWPRTFVAHFWPPAIKDNIPVEGVKLAAKMFFLEAVGILAGVVAAPNKIRGRHVRVHCDNAAAVFGFKKKHSKELLGYSALKAAAKVAQGLGATLSVHKIKRVSCVGALVADLLSKGEVAEAAYYMEYCDEEPGLISRTMMRWLEYPRPTRVLGEAILLELRGEGVPVMIDFMVDEEIKSLAWIRK